MGLSVDIFVIHQGVCPMRPSLKLWPFLFSVFLLNTVMAWAVSFHRDEAWDNPHGVRQTLYPGQERKIEQELSQARSALPELFVGQHFPYLKYHSALQGITHSIDRSSQRSQNLSVGASQMYLRLMLDEWLGQRPSKQTLNIRDVFYQPQKVEFVKSLGYEAGLPYEWMESSGDLKLRVLQEYQGTPLLLDWIKALAILEHLQLADWRVNKGDYERSYYWSRRLLARLSQGMLLDELLRKPVVNGMRNLVEAESERLSDVERSFWQSGLREGFLNTLTWFDRETFSQHRTNELRELLDFLRERYQQQSLRITSHEKQVSALTQFLSEYIRTLPVSELWSEMSLRKKSGDVLWGSLARNPERFVAEGERGKSFAQVKSSQLPSHWQVIEGGKLAKRCGKIW
jgi:hypothetical protein